MQTLHRELGWELNPQPGDEASILDNVLNKYLATNLID